MDKEVPFPPPGPIIGEQREVMAATYRKQKELDQQIGVQSLRDVLKPLGERYGVDFFDMYKKRYDLEPKKGKKEEVCKSIAHIEDLEPYFVEQDGREYYRYIDRRFHPEKPEKALTDFVILEEELPKGKILAIFDYGVRPHQLASNEEIEYRKLVGCYAVIGKGVAEEEQAVDLMSFWSGAEVPSGIGKVKKVARGASDAIKAIKRVQDKYPGVDVNDLKDKAHFDLITDPNRVFSIGLYKKNDELSMQDRIEIIKEEGTFLFRDGQGGEKWLEILIPVAAFSQDEGDRAETVMRSDLPLGMVRELLGEAQASETDLIEQLLTEANKKAEEQGISLREEIEKESIRPMDTIVKDTRDWVRNRMAVSLYIIRKLHHMGIDFVSDKEYPKLTKTVNDRLKTLEQGVLNKYKGQVKLSR